MRTLTAECIRSLAMFVDRAPFHSNTRAYISHADLGGNPVLTIDDEIPCRCIAPVPAGCVGCVNGFWPRKRQYSVLPFGSFVAPMGGIENCTPLDEDTAREWYASNK